MDEHTKTLVDTASVATVVGTLAGILPAIAALFTIVWTCIRIYESRTIQDFLKRRKGG
jgi:glycerol-3-phosphate acyltransferase PlsY